MPLIAIVVILAFAFYVMKPEERLRVARGLLRPVVWLSSSRARRGWRPQPADAAPPLAPHERTQTALVVPAIVALNVVIYIAMLLAPSGGPEQDVLVAWGGNFGPRTTNGEWSRLLVSLFVHRTFLHLLATTAGLVQAGLIVERLAGCFTFSAVYATAGFFASAVSLWLHPIDVSVGASGAVFGLYGFVAANSIQRLRRLSFLSVARQTPAAALFVMYNAMAGGLRVNAELAGCTAGFVIGLVLTHHIAERKVAVARVLTAVGATFVLAAAIAVPLYGLADVRPEIEHMVTIENGTASRYETSVERFRRGVISAKDLAREIRRNIVPQLESVQARFASLGRVPHEHEPLVERARQFLRMREESWRLRAKALETGNMTALRRADAAETASLQTLTLLIPPVGQ